MVLEGKAAIKTIQNEIKSVVHSESKMAASKMAAKILKSP